MNSDRWVRFLFVILFLVPIFACGGSSGNNSGGGNDPPPNPPPSTTEILYGANGANTIYAFQVDQTSGGLTQTASVAPGGLSNSNTELTVTPTGTFLYALNTAGMGVNAYSTGKSGTLSLISGSPSPVLPGIQPSNFLSTVVADPSGKFLYVGTAAGFGGVASFSIDSTTGTLSGTGGPFSTFSQQTGGGTPVRIAIDPGGSFLYASDQSQSVWAFSINAQDGTLTAVPGSPFAAGSQPFGLAVEPSGKFLYVALSNSNSIAAFSIDRATGTLALVPGSPFPTSSMQFTQTYEIAIHPTGKFLYAFNLNGNTVAAFTIDSTSGVLSPISGSPFAITPNAQGDLVVDPSGKFLYLTAVPPPAMTPPSAFIIFDINTTTGALTANPQSPVLGSQEPQGLAVAQFQ
jgi:6-phosphogluconolactonase